MQQHRESEDAKDGKKGVQDGVVMVTVACDGMCDRCPNALAKEVQAVAGGEETICRFGWKYLRTDAPTSNLFGVGEADALGQAGEFARANRERKSDSVASAEPTEARTISAQAPTFGTLAGRRSGNMNPGQKERRFEMNVGTENAKDMQLLNLRGLAPLDTSAVAADGDLVAMVEVHNARLARGVDRLRHLAADRERLADFDAWLAAESADIATARCRVRREALDAVLELRRVLEEREVLLSEMEKRLRGRYGCGRSFWQAGKACHFERAKQVEKSRRGRWRCDVSTARFLDSAALAASLEMTAPVRARKSSHTRRYVALDEAHSAAIAAAEKRLAKERSALEKANPCNAGIRFVELVADEEPVAEAAEVLASAREAFESVAAARRAVGGDLTMVTTRQREVFAWLMA